MIEVEYTCDACGIVDAKVEVRDRGVTEDVGCWVEGPLAHAISFNHRLRSPRCTALAMTLVKIPLPAGHTRVGDPTRH